VVYAFFGEEFQEYSYSEDFIFVEFPDTQDGMGKLFRYIYKNKIFAVNTYDIIGLSVVFFCLKKTLNIKIVYMPIAMLFYWNNLDSQRATLKGKIKNIFSKYLYIFSLKNADLIITTPVIALENEILRNKKDVYTSDWIFHLGAIDFFHTESINFDKSFLSDYDNKFLTYSRIEKGKDIDSVINAYIKIKNKTKSRSCLVIIGDGEYLPELKTKYKHVCDLYFQGWLEREESHAIIKSMDLLIAPDGGYSIIEAGLLGTPTLSFNFDVMSTLIAHSFNGYLVDKNDKYGIERIMLSHIQLSASKKKLMKNNCYKYFSTRFDKERIEEERKNVTNKIQS
jgi:glycosyltransferase involved in cell wall biosynthesis